jgi:cytochrome c5
MLILTAALAGGCGQGIATTSDLDLGATAGGSDMTMLVNGCPSWPSPLSTPDGGAGGDTWASFAQPFFASYCTLCHSSTLSGAARNGAPDGYNWDDEATVRQLLDQIRPAVGVINFMPPSDPSPSCDERRRLVRWIDAAAP